LRGREGKKVNDVSARTKKTMNSGEQAHPLSGRRRKMITSKSRRKNNHAAFSEKRIGMPRKKKTATHNSRWQKEFREKRRTPHERGEGRKGSAEALKVNVNR